MLGKYCISCLGGPGGILESFLKNTADLQSDLLAGMNLKDAYVGRQRARGKLCKSIGDWKSEWMHLWAACSHFLL